MHKEELKMSPPWVVYYREIEALFGEDPDIRIEFDEDEYIIKLFVENVDKADALSQLLPDEKVFGSVTVYTTIIPANRPQTKADLIRRAFEGNPAFSYATTIEGVFSNPITYVAYKNKVVQYFGDNLHDPHGNVSTLYQEIAKDVIGEDDGVWFCTDLPGNFGNTKK